MIVHPLVFGFCVVAASALPYVIWRVWDLIGKGKRGWK